MVCTSPPDGTRQAFSVLLHSFPFRVHFPRNLDFPLPHLPWQRLSTPHLLNRTVWMHHVDGPLGITQGTVILVNQALARSVDGHEDVILGRG
jgi:hypothetical protein